MLDRVDEILTAENWQIHNFHRLGFDTVEAIDAVRNGIDYHEIEPLIEQGCSKETALRILASLEG